MFINGRDNSLWEAHHDQQLAGEGEQNGKPGDSCDLRTGRPRLRPQHYVSGSARPWSFTAIQDSGQVRTHMGDVRTGCSRQTMGTDQCGEATMTRLLIVDDYALYRGVRRQLRRERHGDRRAWALDAESLCVALEGHAPDVVLVNMTTPPERVVVAHGLRGAPNARVIALGISRRRANRRSWLAQRRGSPDITCAPTTPS